MEDSNHSFEGVKFKNERIVRRSFVFWCVETAFFIAVELVIRQIIFSVFTNHIYYGSVGVQLFKNYNFAFSIYLPTSLMYLVYTAAIIAICVYLYKNFFTLKQLQVFAWSLILAGALANVGERLLLGYVRDYLYIFSGIFNLADLYIIAGTLTLLLGSNKKPK